MIGVAGKDNVIYLTCILVPPPNLVEYIYIYRSFIVSNFDEVNNGSVRTRWHLDGAYPPTPTIRSGHISPNTECYMPSKFSLSLWNDMLLSFHIIKCAFSSFSTSSINGQIKFIFQVQCTSSTLPWPVNLGRDTRWLLGAERNRRKFFKNTT